uniref:ATP-binding cassette domain-containing protein n=1 Tax=Providencia stuartii TaxID=588 RepID=A0AAI9HWE8_PROST|nr:ATP-binding cassette domain-containing protein [Providencia sp. PROV152]ELR5033889.1 ATP-binding cassette domain-containing protein [Providencia stuartii]
MIVVDNLEYRWPNAMHATISQLTLTINTGESVALVGDNGAGKSTLLRLVAGLLRPTQGQIQVNCHKLSALNAMQRANQIGILFQEVEKQIFHSRVKDEVAFGLRRQKLSQQEINERTLKTLKSVHLQDVADSHPLDLNAGQRRMVAVACLSAVAPKILLLDEPTRDFDACWLSRFEQWLALQQSMGTTILAISHDLDFVARNFKRAIHLSAGTVIADGPPEHTLRHPDLQPDLVLPAPTLYSLSNALGLERENDPKCWANKFIAKSSTFIGTHVISID